MIHQLTLSTKWMHSFHPSLVKHREFSVHNIVVGYGTPLPIKRFIKHQNIDRINHKINNIIVPTKIAGTSLLFIDEPFQMDIQTDMKKIGRVDHHTNHSMYSQITHHSNYRIHNMNLRLLIHHIGIRNRMRIKRIWEQDDDPFLEYINCKEQRLSHLYGWWYVIL